MDWGLNLGKDCTCSIGIEHDLSVCYNTNNNYIFQGGMKAVIWTDVFQFLVIMAGILAILIKVNFAGLMDFYDVKNESIDMLTQHIYNMIL